MSERNLDNRFNGMSLWTELQMQMTVVLRHSETIPNVPRQDGSGAHTAWPIRDDENVKRVGIHWHAANNEFKSVG